ncbi:MAG TPA: AraC family transcriptional regulator, partial [Thalassospira sp.]|nr:AraC family transcriptional regulator [Thalassospira sp.]
MPERITNTTSIRMIACFAFDDVMSLDVVGPLQVFASANAELERQGRERDYEVLVIADAAGPVPTSGGFRLYADLDWRELELQATDTVLI